MSTFTQQLITALKSWDEKLWEMLIKYANHIDLQVKSLVNSTKVCMRIRSNYAEFTITEPGSKIEKLIEKYKAGAAEAQHAEGQKVYVRQTVQLTANIHQVSAGELTAALAQIGVDSHFKLCILNAKGFVERVAELSFKEMGFIQQIVGLMDRIAADIGSDVVKKMIEDVKAQLPTSSSFEWPNSRVLTQNKAPTTAFYCTQLDPTDLHEEKMRNDIQLIGGAA